MKKYKKKSTLQGDISPPSPFRVPFPPGQYTVIYKTNRESVEWISYCYHANTYTTGTCRRSMTTTRPFPIVNSHFRNPPLDRLYFKITCHNCRYEPQHTYNYSNNLLWLPSTATTRVTWGSCRSVAARRLGSVGRFGRGGTRIRLLPQKHWEG